MNPRDFDPQSTVSVTVTADDVVDLESKIEVQERALTEDKKRLAAYQVLIPVEAVAQARRRRTKTPPPHLSPQQAPLQLPPVAAINSPLHPALMFSAKDVSLQGGIIRTLAATGRGMTHEELRDAMDELDPEIKRKWEHFGERSFYKAVGNVINRRVVIKHHGYLYAREVFEAMQARGERFPIKETRALPRRGTGYAVQKLLEREGKALTSEEIYGGLIRLPEMPKSLKKQGMPYLRKILLEMVERKDVIEFGGKYQAPEKAKG